MTNKITLEILLDGMDASNSIDTNNNLSIELNISKIWINSGRDYNSFVDLLQHYYLCEYICLKLRIQTKNQSVLCKYNSYVKGLYKHRNYTLKDTCGCMLKSIDLLGNKMIVK